MKEFIFAVIGILVISYILDKRPPIPTKNGIEIIKDVKYDNYFINKEYSKEVQKIINILKSMNPLQTPVIWTYVEIFNNYKDIQLMYDTKRIPEYFKQCIDKLQENSPSLIVLTPQNISYYLPDFPIKMIKDSKIPFRKRVDILFSFILYEYGGICVSPGTIVYKTELLIDRLFNHDIVTVGSSPRIINGINYKLSPNTYIIGSKPKSNIISEYKRLLLMSVKNNHLYNLINKESYDILSELLHKNKVIHYHFGPEFDGTYNNNQSLLELNDYLGTEKINFMDPSNTFAICVPYEKLFLQEYGWFLRLSKEQFNQSNLEIKRLLKEINLK